MTARFFDCYQNSWSCWGNRLVDGVRTLRIAVALTVSLVLIPSDSTVLGQLNTNWINPVSGPLSGNWSTGTNWSNGVPNSTTNATIENGVFGFSVYVQGNGPFVGRELRFRHSSIFGGAITHCLYSNNSGSGTDTISLSQGVTIGGYPGTQESGDVIVDFSSFSRDFIIDCHGIFIYPGGTLNIESNCSIDTNGGGVNNAGELNISNGILSCGFLGTFEQNGVLGTINLNGGVLYSASSFSHRNLTTLNFNDGLLQIVGNGTFALPVNFAVNSPNNAMFSIDNGAQNSSYPISNFVVGGTQAGSMFVFGQSELYVGNCYIADSGNGSSNGYLNIDDASYFGTGFLSVGDDGDGAMLVTNESMVMNGNGFIGGRDDDGVGVATVRMNSIWHNNNLYLGGDASQPWGTGTLNIASGGTVDVIGTTKLWPSSTINLDSGNLTTTHFDNSQGGNLNHSGGTLTIDGGSYNPGPAGYTINGANNPKLVLTNAVQMSPGNNFVIGNLQSGTLEVLSGSQVNTGNGYIADKADSNGFVSISGSGSRWNGTGFLSVGDESFGAMSVRNGAVVANATGYLGGRHATGGGVAFVGGSDVAAQWNNSNLYLGGNATQSLGTGLLEVQLNGTVDVSGTTKLWPGSSITIYDGGNLNTTNLDNSENGTINMSGGTLTVDGGTFTSGATNTVDGANNPTLRLIDASGSAGITSVGFTQLGTLDVQFGSAFNSARAYIGRDAGSTGTVTVSGPGTEWFVTDSAGFGLRIGDFGEGTVTISNGGTVSDVWGYIGTEIGSVGDVTVSGNNSLWENSMNAYVGLFGDGTLLVQDEGVVTSNAGIIANSSAGNTSTGIATITGAGSRWDINEALIVGRTSGADATLDILGGGVVTSGDGFVGQESGTDGTVNVTGSGSQWLSSGDLYVGGSDTAAGGTGILNVDTGGSVDVTGTTKLWPGGTINLGGGELITTHLDNTEGGTFNFTGGVLRLEGGTWSASGFLDVAAGATLTGNGTINGNFVNYGNVHVNSGTLVVTGGEHQHDGNEWRTDAGAQTTFAGFFYQGAGDGDFQGAGTVRFESVIINGVADVTNFEGDVEFASSAVTFLDIEGINAGEFDQFVIDGNLTLNGTLNVFALGGGFTLSPNQQFLIADVAGTVTGQFSNLTEGGLVGNYNGVDLFITYGGGDGNDVVLYSEADNQVLLGDVNQDGIVNLLDVAPFIEVIGTGDFQAEADCNEDGVVNLLDVDPFIVILTGG